MRLDRFLANSGLGTRKEVKEYIKALRVTVNNHLVKSEKFNIDEINDVVCFDNEKVNYQEFYYILLNKPEGYVSSTLPEGKYPPVTDLVNEFSFAKVTPVGRLDVDTTGVLLLSNNGILAHRLLSPKYHVDKTYLVTTDYSIQKEMVVAFEKGVVIDGEKLLPAKLEILSNNEARVTIHQGKYHQVKRMFAHYGLTVVKLVREKFAFLEIGELNLGEYRELTKEEVNNLLSLVD